MDDALGVHDHIEPVVRETKEKMRLDDLERLVDEGGAVDRDLGSHAPRRVLQCLVYRGRRDAIGLPGSKRAPRRGEDETTGCRARAGQALEDRAVLGGDGT